VFALAYTKNVIDDDGLEYINPVFQQKITDKLILNKIAKLGSCQKIEGISDSIKKVFVTAYDIDPKWHIKMQAAFQKYTENAVSKTINFSQNATIDDIQNAYLLAWELGCKGITIYRSGSKEAQILSTASAQGSGESKQLIQSKIRIKPLKKSSPAGECPECGNQMEVVEGCYTCKHCGFSKCSL